MLKKNLVSPLIHFTRSVSVMSDKPKLLVTRISDEIPQQSLEMLKPHFEITHWSKPGPITRQGLKDLIPDKDALFCLLTDKIDQEILQCASQLKVIGSMAVGYDHLEIPSIREKGIKVGYTPDVLTQATAELTVALLLATSRRLFEAADQLKKGGWGSWDPLWMCGPSLNGSTVGIVGLGRIGQMVQKMLTPFGVNKFLYHGRKKLSEDLENGSEFQENFEDLLKKSDFVIATCALTQDTANLFDKKAFDLMKPNGVFINTSRGGVVNQEDLIEALQNYQIAMAGLDVMTPEPLPTDHPLTKLENCVLIPHIGSATFQTRTRMATLTAENLIAAISGQNMPAELK